MAVFLKYKRWWFNKFLVCSQALNGFSDLYQWSTNTFKATGILNNSSNRKKLSDSKKHLGQKKSLFQKA